MLICCYFYIETTEYKPVKLDTSRTVKLHPRVTVIYCRYMVWSFILSKYWGSFNSDCFRFFNKANSAHQIISSYLPFGAQRSCATLIDLLHWSQLCSFLLPMTCFHFSVTRTWTSPLWQTLGFIYLVFRKILNLLWQKIMFWWKFSLLLMAKYWKII